MNDDELRDRVRSLDPADVPADSTWLDALTEATMSTSQIDPHAAPETIHRSRGPRTLLAAAAAAVILAGGGTAYVVSRGSDPAPLAATEISLKVGASDATAMCIRFDPSILAQMPVAFSGTVVEAPQETNGRASGDVVLDVDHWFTGGSADRVRLQGTPTGIALDGTSFEQGGRYLVSATDGQVTSCGYSGPYTDDFAAEFAAAFGD